MAQIAAVVYVLSPWLDFANYQLPNWAGMIGAVVYTIALSLLWRSHADLGGNWSATLEIRERHWLVTHGVYGRLRHPMYAAHWLWGIAQALLIQNWIAGVGGLLFFAPLYLLRVPGEEAMLFEHFGDEYREYMNRTGRVIPRLK